MDHRRCLVVPAVLGALLCGCVSKDLVFVTKTSTGLDIDGTPTSISLAYDRVEGFIGPQYSDGFVPPVFGFVDLGGAFPERDVRQKFAVGRAAKVVAGIDLPPAKESSSTEDKDPKTMFFGTTTTLGLKFGLDSAGTAVASASLGYKRKELSVMPVTGRNFPSVFASIGAEAKPAAGTDAKFGAAQFFATGAAADQIAYDLRGDFNQQAKDALANYRSEQLAQQSAALLALSCVSRLKDSQLADAFANADELSIFDEPVSKSLSEQGPVAARATYARNITVLNAKVPAYTVAIRAHEKHVCTRANQS